MCIAGYFLNVIIKVVGVLKVVWYANLVCTHNFIKLSVDVSVFRVSSNLVAMIANLMYIQKMLST